MQPSSIEQIDRAALTLLQALAEHGDAMAPYFEPGHLQALNAELVTLRQALLGLQMGRLYWGSQAEETERKGSTDDGALPHPSG
jgi:hypothetical protein